MKKFLLLLLFALPAWAEDFEFSIPVKLSSLMATVDDVLISCVVMDEDELVLGKGDAHIQPEDGAYEGTVMVKFNADPGMNPQAASLYKCTLRLHHHTKRQYLTPNFREDESDWPVWAVAKPDTNLVYEVEGTIGENVMEKAKK